MTDLLMYLRQAVAPNLLAAGGDSSDSVAMCTGAWPWPGSAGNFGEGEGEYMSV